MYSFETFKCPGNAESIRVITTALNKIDESLYPLLLSAIQTAQRGKNSINFTDRYFPIDKQTAISMALFKNKCVAFSSIWNRKSFWGNSVYRVTNRTWYDPSYRIATVSKKTPHIFILKTMIYQQLKFIEQMSTTYIAFISREGDRRKTLKWFLKKVSVPFHICDSLCLVCQDRSSPSCWHTVAFFQKGSLPFPFEKMKPPFFWKGNEKK